MRSLVFALATLVASAPIATGSAFAADLSPAAPAYKALPVATYDWTGFYLGAHGGWGRLDSADGIVGANTASANILTGFGAPPSLPLGTSGAVAGGQVGYNRQFGFWLAGIETDLSWTDLDSAATLASTIQTNRVFTADAKLDWFGTLRGRIGVLPSERLLLYATGGLAYGHAQLSTNLTTFNGAAVICVIPGGANNCEAGSTSALMLGWTVGGGAEWAFARRWSAKAEYLYYDLGTLSHAMTDPNFPYVFDASADVKGSIARAGVNFKFD
jgi:outer membrane immunogenic protein